MRDCSRPATKKLVYNPVGDPRVTEHYCADHATDAASVATTSAHGDLFLGPVDVE